MVKAQPNYVMISLVLLLFLIIALSIWQFFKERKSKRILDEQALDDLIEKSNNLRMANEGLSEEDLDPDYVDEIWQMSDTGAKGHALEAYTAEIYRLFGYRADTIDDLKQQGIVSPTGFDQGADVMVEIPVFDKNTNLPVINPNTGEMITSERIMIQCKAYKTMDEKGSNSAIQQVHACKAYYEMHLKEKGFSLDGKIHHIYLFTTASDITEAGWSLAKACNVKVFLREDIRELVKKANQARRDRMKKDDPEKEEAFIENSDEGLSSSEIRKRNYLALLKSRK